MSKPTESSGCGCEVFFLIGLILGIISALLYLYLVNAR